MGRTSVVEINGRQYDAITGQLVGAVRKVAHHVKTQSRSGVIDGFVRSSQAVRDTQPKPAPKKAARRPQPEAKKLHQHAQRSKTLIRTAVKKPFINKQPVRARSLSANPDRQERAKTVTKSTYVKRFGHFKIDRSNSDMQEGEIVDRPKTAALHATAGHTAIAAAPVPSMLGNVSHQQIENLLDQALTMADAQKRALKNSMGKNPWRRIKAAPRWLTLSVAAVILLTAGALAAWQYIPQASIKAAGMKANINAKAPAYVPAGYKFEGPAKYQDGAVTVDYKSQNGNFAVSQKTSNWDSTSLEANMLNKEQQIQTSQVNGNTVYIYGEKNDAAWVDSGKLYKLKNEANLSPDQVLRIVQSF